MRPTIINSKETMELCKYIKKINYRKLKPDQLIIAIKLDIINIIAAKSNEFLKSIDYKPDEENEKGIIIDILFDLCERIPDSIIDISNEDRVALIIKYLRTYSARYSRSIIVDIVAESLDTISAVLNSINDI